MFVRLPDDNTLATIPALANYPLAFLRGWGSNVWVWEEGIVCVALCGLVAQTSAPNVCGLLIWPILHCMTGVVVLGGMT